MNRLFACCLAALVTVAVASADPVLTELAQIRDTLRRQLDERMTADNATEPAREIVLTLEQGIARAPMKLVLYRRGGRWVGDVTGLTERARVAARAVTTDELRLRDTALTGPVTVQWSPAGAEEENPDAVLTQTFQLDVQLTPAEKLLVLRFRRMIAGADWVIAYRPVGDRWVFAENIETPDKLTDKAWGPFEQLPGEITPAADGTFAAQIDLRYAGPADSRLYELYRVNQPRITFAGRMVEGRVDSQWVLQAPGGKHFLSCGQDTVSGAIRDTTLVGQFRAQGDRGEIRGRVTDIVLPAPPQVLCYERADDIGFGVSGVVTRARGIRVSFPDLDSQQIPMCVPVTTEKVLYLLDPVGASRRSATLRLADKMVRGLKAVLPVECEALDLPYTPSFLRKHDGLLLSIGQFNQWVGSQLMATGVVQIWPGTPVAKPIFEKDGVVGVRLLDQGVDKQGSPEAGFMPGMDIRAALTVVGDGPVGPIGQALERRLGMPPDHHKRDWAIGMKMVVNLPQGCPLKPGTVFHTFGYPEPEIFGFFYVHPDHVASLGIFVPSWFDTPVRTAYRYLQHWMLHPYLWRYLNGGTLRSWGAKSLQESGRRGEPHLVGDGYARIGEGSGSTNVLTGSGVDEAWTTGVQLAEAVLELLEQKKPFTRENLEMTYVARRRRSWVEKEGRIAEKSRDRFNQGVVSGLVGMAMAGFTGGRLAMPGRSRPPHERIPPLAAYYKHKLSVAEVETIRADCQKQGVSVHNALMDKVGWPAIPYDGKLLVSHQDALLMGGKVQAPGGYADHVVFLYPHLCAQCGTKVCIEVCSGQAIAPGPEGGVPAFDREKCVHCGACLWNCSQANPDDPERGNIEFRAGTGGLHSAEN